MSALEVGDRAPGFDLPAVYGYKAGETSPSAEEKVMVKLKDFKNKSSSEYHDRRDLSQTLLNAIKTLDDSLERLYSTECNCDDCRRERGDNEKR